MEKPIQILRDTLVAARAVLEEYDQLPKGTSYNNEMKSMEKLRAALDKMNEFNAG